MSSRIIVMMLAVTVGLIAAVWILNGLWARSFGVAVPQAPNHAAQVADRKQLREEHDAKEHAKLEKEKYSAETLTTAARSDVPKPLSPQEFDPHTGKIHWPGALLSGDFDTSREKVERALKQHATEPGEGEHARDAHAAAETLLARLKTQIRTLPTTDYLAAHHFLDGLIYYLRPKPLVHPAEGKE